MIFTSIRTNWKYQDALAMAVGITCLAGMLLIAGCEKKSGRDNAGRAFAVRKEYKRGPCSLTIKVDKKEISIAEHLQLILEVRAREGVKVELPKFGDKLDQFSISDFREPAPRMVADKLVLYARAYTLSPFLSGTYKIAPMTITFQQPGEKKKHEIKSEQIEINVKSLLPGDAAKLKIRDIAGPVSMPRPDHTRLMIGLLAGVLVLGLISGAIMLRKRGRSHARAVARKSAHEIAREELAALIAEDLPGRGMIKQFYQRLSGILRHYIENRFSLRAPELTTEEFLEQLRNTDQLGIDHKNLLRDFLQHCDLVKFAALAPATSEIQQTFDACKRFIEETMVVEAET